MKNTRLIFLGMFAGIFLGLTFLWVGAFGKAFAEQPQPGSTSTPVGAGWRILSAAESDEIPAPGFPLGVQAPEVLPTAIPGETLVYFFTSDSDATATVLNLLNTDSIAHTVALRGYSSAGVLGYSLNINVPATSILRLVSDSVAAAPPPSWSTPAPIVTNFTDFTYFASLSLPKGVKVDGYTLFNPGTGVVDPRADQGAIPLRFSSDPASIFLPAVKSGP